MINYSPELTPEERLAHVQNLTQTTIDRIRKQMNTETY
jgi:hypothetical protein